MANIGANAPLSPKDFARETHLRAGSPRDPRHHKNNCVCANCTCGKHKKVCKPTPDWLSGVALEVRTENNDQYVKYNVRPAQSAAPKYVLPESAPFEDRTENRERYVPQPMPKRYQVGCGACPLCVSHGVARVEKDGGVPTHAR